MADRLGTAELAALGPPSGAQRGGGAGGSRCAGRSGTRVDREPRRCRSRLRDTFSWPARVEVVGERPWLVIDGAHNAASAAALADTLLTCFPPTRRTLVFGTTRDKDMETQLRALLPLFDVVIATRYIENARAVAPEDVAAAVFDLSGHAALIAADPAEALELARQATAPEDLICVTGSLFLAAESRAIIMPHVRGPAITEAVT